MALHVQSRARLCVAIVLACAACFASVTGSHAGLADRIKNKMKDEANQKTDEAVDKSAAKAESVATGKDKGKSSDAKGAAPAAPSSASGGSVASVSTKFDYVPGDSVLFLDDFRQDDLGEFPARWRLVQGTFEVAEMEGERWLRCTSADGTVRLKLPAAGALPEFWTLDLDFYGTEPMPSALTVKALSSGGATVWSATYPQGKDLAFRSGDVFSTTPLEGAVGGRHHVSFMARGKAIKAYMDRQRMASVPEYAPGATAPAIVEIRLWAPSQPMITNVRLAEGCRPAKDMLAEGKLVTYGILFATGSDAVLPESAPVLRQISAYMEANPGVKLKITGHTDNVGTPASNLDLSKRRAASVAKILSSQFGVGADRFQTDGKGDTQAVASNDKPEGRAMNRRVEFAKL
jgi:outer membrane protein OmpA-like peptidoglycan-associated protein